VGGDRFAEARDLFLAALERPPDERAAFLREACGDAELRREVESLLAHHHDDRSSALMDATTAVRPTKPAPPRRIGPYRLLQKLGEGGMGEVYEAEQEAPVKRRVAIKLVKWGMSSDEVLARFEAERQALALMGHPNIARVFDAGATEDGRPYFAMEHVPGIPITAYCDTHRLSVEERLDLFIQVCHGVQHAHQKGVIHRDIKPSNILVMVEDDEPVPKIIDFGVAKATSARLTERTPEYMSPEQAEMTGLDIDTRTDVYSLGVVLYELLVGVRPFDPKELQDLGFDELRRTIREKEPTRPSTRVSSLGADSQTTASNRRTDLRALARVLRGDLDWVTMKALEKDRTRRYGSPAELAADLERHLHHEPVLASPPNTAYRVGKFVRRHRVGVAASTAVIAALVAAVVGTSLGLLQARREAENARQVSEFLVGMFEELDPEGEFGATLSVRDILDRGTGRLDQELQDQPLVRARLMAAIGHTYRKLGYYDEARTLLEGSLEVRRALLGEEHPDVGVSLDLLGQFHYWNGDHARARETLERALAVREAAFGPEHPQVAFTLTALGHVLWRSGEYELARARLESALAIQEGAFGRDHRSVSNVLYYLGVLALDSRDYERAGSVLERSLAIREQALGPDHPQVGWALHELGRIHLDAEDHEAARPIFERALAVQEKAFGPDHLTVAFPVTKLAHVHSLAGHHETAQALFERSLAIREGALGPDHPDLGWTLRPWAGHLVRSGDIDGARRLNDRALAIAESAWGPEHVEVAYCLSERGILEESAGQDERARPLLEHGLAIYRRTFERDHPLLQSLPYRLACLESRAGNREKALERLSEAVDAGWASPRILDDPDLSPLRDDPRFETLVAEVKGRLEKPE
jgi:non-specific serine/threonine protein kinase/serine/threonine-protein kinase